MKTIIISASPADAEHVKKITDKLAELDVPHEEHIASAHKEPHKLLEILDSYKDQKGLVFITIAGRSNALSGFVAANCNFPVIACPPFVDKVDMLVNIHSTLQMPSNVPVLTVLDVGNCVLAVKRILDLAYASPH